MHFLDDQLGIQKCFLLKRWVLVRSMFEKSLCFQSPLRQQQAGETQKCEQMIPRFGRRELWEFVQKNQRSPQSPVSALPSSYKKRVAAPQKRKHQKALVDASLLQSTAPLPISRLSNVKTTKSAHLSKVRGNPCVGIVQEMFHIILSSLILEYILYFFSDTEDEKGRAVCWY